MNWQFALEASWVAMGSPPCRQASSNVFCACSSVTELGDSGKGSHCWLVSETHPRIRWAFHRREVSSIEVRRLLVNQVGLTLEEARRLVK